MSHRLPGLVLTEHEISVPLDHAQPDGAQISVFAREVADPDGRDKPFLVFFQGGPGFEASRPVGSPRSPSWLDRALKDYRVLLLDQRGTGRSAPVGWTLPGSPCILATPSRAGMAELVDAADSKSVGGDTVWVQVPLPAPAAEQTPL